MELTTCSLVFGWTGFPDDNIFYLLICFDIERLVIFWEMNTLAKAVE